MRFYGFCNHFNRFGLALVAATVFWFPFGTASAHAQSAEEVYAKIIATVVLPGFTHLEAATDAHAKDWVAMCGNGDATNHSATIASFHEMADAWAAVEMFRMGPASRDFRRDRLYLWPERKNAVARALASALSTPVSTQMNETWMVQQSAAIQGLPVLERLLFDDGSGKAAEQFLPNTTICKLGVAVSRNAAQITHDIATEWSQQKDIATAAARTALATDIVTGIALAKDDKIEAVIGRTESLAKPKAAEFWRSRRSLRNLALNMETYAAIAKIIAPKFETVNMSYAAATVSQTIAGMHEPLGDYGKAALRSDVYFLKAAIDGLGDSASNEVSAALGVTVGFNSSDGD